MNPTEDSAKPKPRKRKSPNVQPVSVAGIREMIDGVATELLVGETSPDAAITMVATLTEIGEAAKAAGLAGIPELTTEIAAALKAGSDEDGLLSGITRLQKALQQEALPKEVEKLALAEVIPIASDPELLAEFLVESRDHLASVESHLLILEQSPWNTDATHATFRGFHTIKGLAGFLEFPAMQAVSHEVENLLDRVRNGKLSVTPRLIDVVLESADYLKTDLARIERAIAGEDMPAAADTAALLSRIRAQSEPKTTAEVGAPSEPESPVIEVSPVENAEPATNSGEEPKARTAASRFVKVDTTKLDFLVDMVGELVIAQSIVHHDGHLSSSNQPKLQRNLAQLTRITGEVQKTAMAMRMVPIGQLFQRSVRLVRDLTRRSGKKAEVVLTGEHTELDRTIVEDLADPLIHMIRNAADHGVETPEERTRAGKSPVAKIGLKAYHEAGHIVIEVSDDGRGLNRERILEKARQNGLVQDAAHLGDRDVLNLIFEPGFTTAEKVTEVSGRGVGMDVVRKQIQKMRGRVEIDSAFGKGTTFYLKLPLTLAIIDGLVVGIGDERYIVPIYVVKEMFRPTSNSVFTLENRREMVLVRDRLLPVMRLYERFKVKPRCTDVTQSLMVVVESGPKRFCLMVDRLIGKQEVVIKNLGDTFKHVAGFAGGAILGDGRVGLILEVDGLYSETARA